MNGQLPLPRLRAQLVETSRRLHQMGWVANHDGNVSVRLTGNRFLITCTAISKVDVDDAGLLVVNQKGEVLEGRRKPFGELDLHLAAYRARPDAMAVVHAHPPYATATGLVGQALDCPALPEAVVSLGVLIPLGLRTMPRSEAGVKQVEGLVVEHDAVLLCGNGALTLGDDLNQALLRMELVEHLAKIMHLARVMGTVKPLSAAELETLLAARTKAGLGAAGRAQRAKADAAQR
jgi:L-fuculose-phosphate aldolase